MNSEFTVTCQSFEEINCFFFLRKQNCIFLKLGFSLIKTVKLDFFYAPWIKSLTVEFKSIV